MKINIHKIVIASGLLGLTAISAFAAYWDTWKVTVESNSYGWRLLRVPTDRPIRLVKKLSHADCKYGVSWGISDRGIWVDNGCRAVFEIAGRRPTTWIRDWDDHRHDRDHDHDFHEWRDRDWRDWHGRDHDRGHDGDHGHDRD